MKKYPDCFPDDFEERILSKGARFQSRSVYRIMKFGKINRDNFLSTFEETERGLRPPGKRINVNDPGIYSTSCNMEYAEAKYVLGIMMRHYPEPFIALGTTMQECGPSQLTSERIEDNHTTHVDWWIYENAQPQQYFEEVYADEK